MADNTKIEWTDATWNPITGCSVVSPGCKHCYAMRLAGTRMQHHPSRAGLAIDTKEGPVWNGTVRLNEQWLDQPLRWKKARKIFVCAHGDLFHENVPDEWIDRVFAVMALAPQHVFQVLTKRPERMRAYMDGAEGRTASQALEMAPILKDISATGLVFSPGQSPSIYFKIWPLPNVWLGVSVEDQQRADERIPHLLATPAAVRFLSCEPLLGPVDLGTIQAPRYVPEDHALDWKFNCLETGDYYQFQDSMGVWEGGDGPYRDHKIDWVIVGGESGPNARPMHPDWARQLRDQCAAAGVPFLMKQWGEWHPSRDHDDRVYGCKETPRAIHTSGAAEYRPAEVIKLIGESWIGDDCNGWAGMCRLGKKAAGRLLDGVEHNGMPGETS